MLLRDYTASSVLHLVVTPCSAALCCALEELDFQHRPLWPSPYHQPGLYYINLIRILHSVVRLVKHHVAYWFAPWLSIIHAGLDCVAYRIVKELLLCCLLSATGPIIYTLCLPVKLFRIA